MPVGVSVGIKMLEPWKICHDPLNSSRVCPIKMPIFSLKCRWRYFKVCSTVYYLVVTVCSKETRVPQSRIRLGWSVAIRSIHDGFLLGLKLVGSEMIWGRPSEVKRFSISVPSGFVTTRPPQLRVCIKITSVKCCKRVFTLNCWM